MGVSGLPFEVGGTSAREGGKIDYLLVVLGKNDDQVEKSPSLPLADNPGVLYV